MKILFVTPGKNEDPFLNGFSFNELEKLAAGINGGKTGCSAEILDISSFDLKSLSIHDVEKILSGLGPNILDFEAIHTFSFFPFINRAFFKQFIFYDPGILSLKNEFATFFGNIDDLNCCKCDVKKFSAEGLCDFYRHTLINSKAFDTRPWGWWRTLISADDYKIKQIVVEPHHKLSLQTHEFRSETWIIAEGSGFVVIGSRRFKAEKGLVFTIPKHEKHRAETEDSSMIIIELQLGSYLGEDDVKRIEDIYGRA